MPLWAPGGGVTEDYRDLDETARISSGQSGPSDSDVGSRAPRKSMLETFFERYFERLVGGLRSTYGTGPPDPEEVANHTFLKLSERPDLGDIKDLEAYAWVVAHNRMRTELRSLRVRENYAETTIIVEQRDDFDPERVLGGKQEVDIVTQVLRDMPEKRRGIFIANRIDGLTPEKSGALYGVSRTAALRHIAKATALIAQALEREDGA